MQYNDKGINNLVKVNKLKINPVKTKAIIFCAKNKKVSLHQTIYIDDQPVEIVKAHKILGVYFTSNMSWDNHVDYLCRKLSSVCGALSRSRLLLPLKVKLQIYYALFYSQLNYCCLVYTTTTKTNITKLFRLQKKMIRLIANIERLQTTQDAFKIHNIIKIEHIYEFRLIQAYCFSSASIRHFLTSLADLQYHSANIQTRRHEVWNIPYFRTNYKLQMLSHNLPYLLNKHHNIALFTYKEVRKYFSEL